MGGPFFAMAYQDDLFQQGGAKEILYYPQLEADDCIALTTKYIVKNYPDAQIWIITSDMDYLQLASSQVHLYNLKFKKLTDSKSSFNDPEKDLFCKIVMGTKAIVSRPSLKNVVKLLPLNVMKIKTISIAKCPVKK